ncbi:hypothetical protein GCM10010954_02760 [Halobacillus andaensis]|uniref:Uncharacterized protein n=1 Tax=Halobacillus andaensis TaxID=1176239 RepID=A0A917AXI8_HALAA|nr:hypothetical protein [Halobacillus andaensis]GGF07761.1 hypothetical protein GCM10010954_02760 [Halobacillus andaensis]
MDHRKETIVKEITYWKHNKLLPTQYGDFLLALYTEGEDKSAPNETSTYQTRHKENIVTFVFFIMNLLLLPLSFLVIYFTEMGIIMQTGLLSIFVGIAYTSSRYRFTNDLLIRRMLDFLILILLLTLTIHVISYMTSSKIIVYWAITIHCFVWMILGTIKKAVYLLMFGFLGLTALAILITL